MKKLFTLLFMLGVFHASYSQNVMHLVNRTNCDLRFLMFKANSGSCGYTGDIAYLVPALSSTTVTAPVGEEFIHAEVTGFPYCTGNVAFDISTPQNCYSACPGWTASWYVGTNSGCGGCLPTINAKWDDCYDVNEGILTVIDF